MSVAHPSSAILWNYRHLWAALGIVFLVQMTLFPCLCEVGMAKVKLALSFDALIAIRLVAAKRVGETGRGWIIYAILIWASPLWIESLSLLVHGPH